MDKERLDYACILLTTSSLEVVNAIDKILVDGVLLEVKIMEESGFSLGEDACLLNDESDSVLSHMELNEVYGENEDIHDIDVLVEKINEDWVEAERGRKQYDALVDKGRV